MVNPLSTSRSFVLGRAKRDAYTIANTSRGLACCSFLCCLLSVLALVCPVDRAFGNALYSGTVSGVFSDPVLTGSNPDQNGAPIAYDNTSTAVYTGFGINSITEGDDPIGTGPTSVTFNGASFSNVSPGQSFNLGTLTLHNGTSFDFTLIFGGTLTLSVDVPGVTISSAVSTFDLVATTNANVSAAQDADFIRLAILSPSTLNAYEGQTVTADVFGQIVGDPQLGITGIELAPGQSGNGFIGTGRPVPDTGTTLFLLGSCVGVMVLVRRKLLA